LIILGSFHARAVYGSLAAVGVILSAVYLLWMYQRVFLGEVTNEKNREIPDCTSRERWMLTATVAVIIFMGVYPQPFLRQMDATVAQVLTRVNPAVSARSDSPLPDAATVSSARKPDAQLDSAGSAYLPDSGSSSIREPRSAKRWARVDSISPKASGDEARMDGGRTR
jgi:hypothetical protein